MANKTYVCAACGSSNISSDAQATWSDKRQKWEIVCVYEDATDCEDCGCEVTLIEKAIAETPRMAKSKRKTVRIRGVPCLVTYYKTPNYNRTRGETDGLGQKTSPEFSKNYTDVKL